MSSDEGRSEDRTGPTAPNKTFTVTIQLYRLQLYAYQYSVKLSAAAGNIAYK